MIRPVPHPVRSNVGALCADVMYAGFSVKAVHGVSGMTMKMRRKKGNVVRGAPSGLVLSLTIHALAFFAAGLFVVFQVTKPSAPEFEAPPPVERPKMSLKKPKVKVKKSSQPRASSRIVAKVKTRDMPEIQLPDQVGAGDGLLGGTGAFGGAFLDLPEVGGMTAFGGAVTSGNDLKVSYYNLNLRRNGNTGSMNTDIYVEVVREFIESGWNKSVLAKYYRSPRTLYATSIMIPLCSSMVAPQAFGEDLNYGYCWLALYEGRLVHKDAITFRFWGAADDVLVVAVDGKVVLNACWPNTEYVTGWVSKAVGNYTEWLGNQYRVGGDWITLEPGVSHDLKVIVGENPGGEFGAQLLVEVKDEDYPLNNRGSRIFPMFAMEPPPRELQDSILINMTAGEANVTNVATIFRDY